MARLTATEAARNFSDVLNRVGAGEEIEIMRNGAPVAVLAPPRARLLPAGRLRTLLAALPSVDNAFADVAEGSDIVGKDPHLNHHGYTP